ncbi:hypothetical protein RB622_27375, partial [Dyadobacter sp. LHD-138]|nr:hypothetical protein [Dyadobacter sp. LHD-138]
KSVPFHLTGCQGYFILPFQTIQTLRMKSRFNSPQEFGLIRVFEETGIRPDIVFSGHVHNYQRFSKRYADGKVIPYIVAGAGGYDELHPVAFTNDERFSTDSALMDGINMESFCDNKHGFLKIAIEKASKGLNLTGEYYTIPHDKNPDSNTEATLADRFTLAIS